MRALVRHVRDRFGSAGGRRPYRPDLSDSGLFAAVRFGGSAALSDAREAFMKADSRRAIGDVVAHFRQRSTPRFFVDIGAVPALAARMERERPEWKRRLVEEVERLCDSGPSVFGVATGPLQRPASWIAAPAGRGDDVLHRVSPHFFQFAPRMALADVYVRGAGEALRSILATWIELVTTDAILLGYWSDITVSLRVLALSWTWAVLAGAHGRDGVDRDDVEFAILKVLRADGQFLEAQLEHATPNNHRLTTAFVLWYLGTLFPELAGRRPWREHGLQVWLEELHRQTFDDGGEFEHALGYHLSVCEAVAAFILLQERNGGDVPAWVRERARRLFEFHVLVGGAQPRPLGDSADYLLFPLGASGGWSTAAVGELGRSMFGLQLPGAGTSEAAYVEQTFWMLGGARAPADDKPERTVRAYPDSGYYVFESSQERTEFLFRTGPAPDRSVFAGHMHADLLSVYLKARGQPLIVEAGTYTYRTTAGDWRGYLAGPDAHNGLSIAGHDPLQRYEGDFRPRHTATRVRSRSAVGEGTIGWVEGTIEGPTIYRGYRRGVMSLDFGFWVVYDVVPEHVPLADVSFGFQLEPGVRAVGEANNVVRIEANEERLAIVPSAGFRMPSIDAGRVQPPRGWVSPGYGSLVPAPQIRFASDRTRRRTAFVLAQGDNVPSWCAVHDETDSASGMAIEIAWPGFTDRIIVGGDAGPVRAFGGEFDGAMIWLRCRGSEPVALHCFDTCLVRLPASAVHVEADRRREWLSIGPAASGGVTTRGHADGVSICWSDAVVTR